MDEEQKVVATKKVVALKTGAVYKQTATFRYDMFLNEVKLGKAARSSHGFIFWPLVNDTQLEIAWPAATMAKLTSFLDHATWFFKALEGPSEGWPELGAIWTADANGVEQADKPVPAADKNLPLESTDTPTPVSGRRASYVRLNPDEWELYMNDVLQLGHITRKDKMFSWPYPIGEDQAVQSPTMSGLLRFVEADENILTPPPVEPKAPKVKAPKKNAVTGDKVRAAIKGRPLAGVQKLSAEDATRAIIEAAKAGGASVHVAHQTMDAEVLIGQILGAPQSQPQDLAEAETK